MVNHKLSTESNEFLENLRLYLITSGKRSDEIDDIVDELEVHLTEAEEQGKSIDKIIGQTPKQYMEQLSDAMTTDYLGWIKYVPIIVVGMFAYIILGDALEGDITYSILLVIGYPAIAILFTILIMVCFKYVAANQFSKIKETFIYYVIGLMPLGSFIGLLLIDQSYYTPVIHFGSFGTIVIGILSVLTLIALAIWGKTWIWIILPILLYLPGVLLDFTDFQESTKAMLDFAVIIIGVGIYLFISFKLTNKSK